MRTVKARLKRGREERLREAMTLRANGNRIAKIKNRPMNPAHEDEPATV